MFTEWRRCRVSYFAIIRYDSRALIKLIRVSDADVEEEGVPVAPLDVRCHDANKDYVVVTWKQPAVEGSSSIMGYFIDR